MNKKKILIVEDDKLNQLAYKGLLSKIYDIVICGDDYEFDKALTQDTYDLFIVDLALNCDKDGIDLIKELRLMNIYKDSPIIVVTAFAMRKDRENSLAAGANSFMTKPFDKDNLIAEIEQCLLDCSNKTE
ncbi:MAG: response regulator [Ignavibacteria bacterium]|nr:response regulator [Ignavibacteria bacterium]